MLRLARVPFAVLLGVAAIAAVHARPSRLEILPGTISMADVDVVPRGSILRIYLHDLSPGVEKGATVTRATYEVGGKTPIHFELSYDPNLISPKRLYAVSAIVSNRRGDALWETRVPIRVLTLGNQEKVQLVLRPVERPKAPPESNSFAIDCEGVRFHVDRNDTSATVTLKDSKIVLPLTEAASSKRYSDGTTTLVVSGSAAYFQRPGKAYRDCKVVPDG